MDRPASGRGERRECPTGPVSLDSNPDTALSSYRTPRRDLFAAWRPVPAQVELGRGSVSASDGSEQTASGKAGGFLVTYCARNQDTAVTSMDEEQESPFNVQSPVSSETGPGRREKPAPSREGCEEAPAPSGSWPRSHVAQSRVTAATRPSPISPQLPPHPARQTRRLLPLTPGRCQRPDGVKATPTATL